MSDFGDFDGSDYSDDEEWLYMSDHFDEADELAEHQCPSPQPFEGPYIEYDPYEYWEDLKYLSDGGYYDGDASRKTNKTAAAGKSKAASKSKTSSAAKNPTVKQAASKKRKAGPETAPKTQKRQRMTRSKAQPQLARAQEKEPMIVWRSTQDRDALLSSVPLLKDNASPPVTVTSIFQPRSSSKHPNPPKAAPKADILPPSPLPPIHDTPPAPAPAPAIAGEGFDLTNLGAIAGLLTAEHLDALKSILEAQGLSRDALDVVLADLMEGREREFGEDEVEEGEEGMEEDDEDGNG